MAESLPWPGVLDPAAQARGRRAQPPPGRRRQVRQLAPGLRDPRPGLGQRQPAAHRRLVLVRPAPPGRLARRPRSIVEGCSTAAPSARYPPATAGRRTTWLAAEATSACSSCSLLRRRPLDADRIAALDPSLASVIEGRLKLPEGIADSYGKPLEECLRYPPVGVLHECPGQRLWFAVPAMYGGFPIALMRELPVRQVVDPCRRRLRPVPRGHPRGRDAGRGGFRLELVGVDDVDLFDGLRVPSRSPGASISPCRRTSSRSRARSRSS